MFVLLSMRTASYYVKTEKGGRQVVQQVEVCALQA